MNRLIKRKRKGKQVVYTVSEEMPNFQREFAIMAGRKHKVSS